MSYFIGYIFFALFSIFSVDSSLINFDMLPEDCGRTIYDKEDSNSTTRIIGGEVAKIGSHPWIAKLGTRGKDDKLFFFCGGSIISRFYVLSAAHCQLNANVVRLGEHNTKTERDCEGDLCAPPVQDIPVERIFSADFCPITVTNDLFLLQLETPIQFNDFVRAVCLPKTVIDYDQLIDEPTIVAGWGKTSSEEDSVIPHVLLEVKSPIVERYHCDAFRHIETQMSHLCLGTRGMVLSKGSCNGDSGGPATKVLDLGEGERHYLLGIVSHGFMICEIGPTVFTEVSGYTEWILRKINKK